MRDRQYTLKKPCIVAIPLFSEMERDLISLRTKEALRAIKEKGDIVLGRPVGALGTSKLDGKQEQIRELLKHKVAKSAVARMLGVSRTTLIDYIKSRKIVAA